MHHDTKEKHEKFINKHMWNKSILTNNRNENLLFEYSNIKDISEIENEERGRIQNILQNSKDKINGIQMKKLKNYLLSSMAYSLISKAVRQQGLFIFSTNRYAFR